MTDNTYSNMGGPTQDTPESSLLVYSLTPEEQVFCEAMLAGKSLTDSYLVVKPDCKRESASVQGSRWYKRVKIRAALDELTAQQTRDGFRLLRSGQKGAINTLRQVADGSLNASQERIRACLEILDRTGVSSRHIIGLEPVQGHTDDFKEFLQSAGDS